METTVKTWSEAYQEWFTHVCPEEEDDGIGTDICACRFDYVYPGCGRRVEPIGEEMPNLKGRDGLCEHCITQA